MSDWMSRWEAERDECIDRNNAERETYQNYTDAIHKFADGWKDFQLSGNLHKQASEAAEHFFKDYPVWESWAKAMGLSRDEVKADVIDTLTHVMSPNESLLKTYIKLIVG